LEEDLVAFHPSFFALIKDLTSIISLQGGCAFGLIPRCCGVPHNAVACDTSNFSFFVDFKWDFIFLKSVEELRKWHIFRVFSQALW